MTYKEQKDKFLRNARRIRRARMFLWILLWTIVLSFIVVLIKYLF